MSTLREMAGSAAELGQEVRESVEEFSRSAGKKMAEARDTTGSALHAAASSVRGAAGRLDATGSFVEDITTRNITAKLQKFGRNHLTECVVAGLAIGFLAGSALTRALHARS
jgi:hypothetical protein